MTIHPLVEQQMMLADEGNENLTGINETRFALWTRQVWLSSGSSAPQLSDECALARGGHPIWTVAHKWKGECTEEGIDIYDDFEVSERRIGRFCGKTVPLPIITSGPNLHFTAYTKSIFRGRGFLAHYSADTCGRRLSNDWGFFASPHYSFVLPKNISCQWTVEAQGDEVIAIEFIRINISGRRIPNCKDAVIWVTGRKIENKTVQMATLCGYEKSYEPIIGRFQQTTVFLKTSTLATGTGFVARYTRFTDDVTLMAELNHSLHEDPEGIIRLKPYDGHGVGEIKTGTITQPNDQRMIFYFETFQLRAPSKYDICTDEYFELYDGPSRFYPVIGKYCGSDIPPMVVSTAYALSYRVRIRSNSSHVVMFYKPVLLTSYFRMFHQMPPLWYWCGDTYTALSGTTAGGELVDLKKFCDSGRSWTVMGAFKHLDVNLVTGRNATGTGFKAHYKSKSTYSLGIADCLLFIPSGMWLLAVKLWNIPITRPYSLAQHGLRLLVGTANSIGKKDPPRHQCKFLYRPLGTIIQLDSDADPDEPCFDEVVKVHDGPDKGWPLLMTKCDTHHRQIMSKGQMMLIQYRVGKNKPKLTFTASFQPVNCEYWLSNSGSFTSFPYLRYHECRWSMRAGQRKQIKLVLEIRSSEDDHWNKACNQQAVIIHDGPNKAAKNFTWLCRPVCAEFVSSRETLLLRHWVITTRTSFSFLATFKEVPKGPRPGMTMINPNGSCPH
ncbi:Cubilin [Clonorchis sinensis]|uniref:Cubilin n=1 Tax=Clonorchis sinensis TaxID=79923 RepID=A0A8T1MVS5_CLOSI|nr:Cubilin [Clonorchis sinensis]